MLKQSGTLILFPLLLAGLLLAGAVSSEETGGGREGKLDPALKQAVKASIERGLKYLRGSQEKDGSWSHYPGVTALAATAFLKSPLGYSEANNSFIARALSYLAGLARPDGSIYDRDMPDYNTSVVLLAFQASGNPRYQPLIQRAQKFLLDSQADEGEGYTEKDKFYGGIGYGADLRPDLSNLGFALEALKASDLPANHPAWNKAIQFIQRCQNRSESNDQAWAVNDGGFAYYPGFSFAGKTESYGSMTYAGLLSFVYANLDKKDPRVQAALGWIKKHYTLEENPGLKLQGLYYYYLVFAKALHVYGEPILVDAQGVKHPWREELARKLLALQHPEGYWVNQDPRWWQQNKDLVTSFTLLALEYVYHD